MLRVLGRPIPRAIWYKNDDIVDPIDDQIHTNIVRNDLVISSLRRSDLLSRYTCSATNNNISRPLQQTVMLDLNCKYSKLSIKENGLEQK